jgi:raffinose/stachyose/melibiose transport system permease protein
MGKSSALNSSVDLEVYKVRKSSKLVKVLIYIGLVIWLFVDLFPVYYLFTFSLKDNTEILKTNVLGLPNDWLFSNYSAALEPGKIQRGLLNSTIVAVSTIVLTLVVALMATYALTRIQWRGNKFLYNIFMLGITIPVHVALFPVFVMFSNMGWTNTLYSLIIPYVAFAVPMAIMISTGFMNDIPKELDEAANIDGCGIWGIFFRVIVPLMKPALATVGIYTFLQCWNEFLFANVFLTSEKKYTLPCAVYSLKGKDMVNYGLLGAGLALATFPMLIVYVLLSKRIQESFIVGAVKG